MVEEIGEQEEVQQFLEQAEEEKPKPDGDLNELFRAPSPEDSDMEVDDLCMVDEEDVFGDGGADMEDLVGVSNEDVMGYDFQQQPKRRPVRIVRSPRYRRTNKQYDNYPTMMGMRG